MSDKFHSDETLLTSHKTPSFSFLTTSAKLVVFNVIKPFIKPTQTGLTATAISWSPSISETNRVPLTLWLTRGSSLARLDRKPRAWAAAFSTGRHEISARIRGDSLCPSRVNRGQIKHASRKLRVPLLFDPQLVRDQIAGRSSTVVVFRLNQPWLVRLISRRCVWLELKNV